MLCPVLLFWSDSLGPKYTEWRDKNWSLILCNLAKCIWQNPLGLSENFVVRLALKGKWLVVAHSCSLSSNQRICNNISWNRFRSFLKINPRCFVQVVYPSSQCQLCKKRCRKSEFVNVILFTVGFNNMCQCYKQIPPGEVKSHLLSGY